MWIFNAKKEDKNEQTKKLSTFLNDKLNEQSIPQSKTNNEEIANEETYNKQFKMHIKVELKKKKTFNFLKLSKKERKLLAERKLYNKLCNN